MPAPKVVWGIDVGQVAIKALKLRALDDRIEILDYAYIEHEKILSQPDVQRDLILQHSLERLFREHEVSGVPVAIGVPGRQTLARFTRLPPVQEKKIPDIVRYEAAQQIPFDLDEVIWDYQVFTRHDKGPAEVEVGIFAMKRELVREHLTRFTQAGIEPAIVQANPLALCNACLYDGLVPQDDPKQATVLLDIGADATDLVIVAGPSLWARTVPIGGNHFTETLVQSFKLSFSKAENLKRTAQLSKYAPQIFRAMRPVFQDLAGEVQRTLGFYGSTRRDVRIARVIALGNAFKMPGLQKFLQQNLGVEVVRPPNFNRLTPPATSKATDLLENLLSFGVAYGLGVQGLVREAPITTTLLPPEIIRQVVWRRKTPWFIGAAACLALAAGLVWVRYAMDRSALKEAVGDPDAPPPTVTYEQARSFLERPSTVTGPLRQQARTWLAVADAFQRELNAKKSERDRLKQQIERFLDLTAHNALWPKILNAIYSAIPAPPEPPADLAEYRERLRQAGLPRDQRREIYLEGLYSFYVPDIQQVMEALQNSPIVDPADPRVIQPQNLNIPPGTGGDRAGFLLILQLRTPFKDGPYLINQEVVEKLKAFTEAERQKGEDKAAERAGFYFDRPRLAAQKQLRWVEGPRRPTAGRRGSPPPQRGGSSGEEGLIDPVLEEPMTDDWICALVVGVGLGEPPPAPK